MSDDRDTLDDDLDAPEGKAPFEERRLDNWANPTTGQGILGVDNRLSWMPYAKSRNQRRQRDLWIGDGLAGTIVERPANDMTRARGVVKLGEGMAEAERTLQATIEELSVWPSAAKALKYDRAYGGGALVMSVDDGMPWSQPVDTSRLRRVRALIPATPDELQAEHYFSNPERSAEYGKPALYRWRPQYIPGIDGGGLTDRLVHASRVIAFTGLDVDNELFVENGGWGASLLDRCEEPLRDTASALAGIGTGLGRFSQEVLGMKELNRILGDKQGKQRLAERVQDMKLYQSILGVLLIDKEELYERKPLSMAGVADTLRTLFQRLSAISNIPQPILFGFTEAGLGDTGRSFTDTWHAWVDAERNNRLRPGLEKLIRLLLLSKEGPTAGIEPPHWVLEFGPLSEPTQAEKDGQRKTQAEIDQIYITNQVVSPADVASSRFQGPDGFSTTTEVDMSAFEPVPPSPPEELAPAEPRGDSSGFESGAQPASAQPLNGAQVEAANGIIERVAVRTLPRASGVEQLVGFFNLSREQAERMMGEVGRSFFAAPGEEMPARTDSASEYAELLVRELEQGELAEAEVVRKVARLYQVEPRQARVIIRRLRAQHQDAAERTNFPRPGENKKPSLHNSSWPVFDPAYAADLRENWPEVWRLGGNVLGNTQFQRLLPLARGAAVDTPLEEHAVRLREAWAARHERNKRPAGVVALVKWLVVGRMGEARMKALLEAEKDRVRRRREHGGAE